MRTITTLALAITTALSTTSAFAQSDIDMHIAAKSSQGQPSFVTGNLGVTGSANTVATLKSFLLGQEQFGATGNEDFVIKRQWTDELGKRHTQVSQTINGIKVYGTSMIVHADLTGENGFAPLGADAGKIYAISGRLAVSNSRQSASEFSRSDLTNRFQAMKTAREMGKVESKPELAYIYLPLSGETKLAYKTEVTWDKSENDFGHDVIFLDAQTGELLTSHPKMHQAKTWKTHDFKNGSSNVGPLTLPGVLKCTNTQSCGADASIQRAHDSAASVYDYYKARFNRSSLDNNDLTLVSTVHVGNNYANAFWYNNKMWYGDGNGTTLNDLTLAYDVVGHELTHGVVEHTAALVYANASGALNEAYADIFGISADAFKKNSLQPDWKLGEEVMVQGGALRYMNNPTQDNYSKDWYPERIPYVAIPTNNNDKGGVHGNSGIANLAYVLLTDGGTHPRGKSPAVVAGVGLVKAEQIFYRALTTYMNDSTNFAGARTATAQAAADLYGATEVTAVNTAWCAVGVGACPDGGNGGGNATPPINESTSNISVGNKAWKRYTQELVAGYTTMTVTTSGGTGDGDLYLRNGSQPSTTNYVCRSWATGNSETCTVNNPAAGTWHIGVHGYTAASGITLNITAN